MCFGPRKPADSFGPLLSPHTLLSGRRHFLLQAARAFFFEISRPARAGVFRGRRRAKKGPRMAVRGLVGEKRQCHVTRQLSAGDPFRVGRVIPLESAAHESSCEAPAAMFGVPFFLGRVRRVASFSASVWHCSTLS